MKAIKDEFSNLPISRQRKYQLRNHKAGRCVLCQNPVTNRTYCEEHRIKANTIAALWRKEKALTDSRSQE